MLSGGSGRGGEAGRLEEMGEAGSRRFLYRHFKNDNGKPSKEGG